MAPHVKFLGLAITLGALACGPAENRATSLLRCQAAGDSVLFTAVTKYVEQVAPKPRRFLVTTVGDSVLPDAGRAALQQKGPMYLYPASPALVAPFRQQLAAKGNFVTLLVAYGGVKQLGDARAVVQLRGRFVGGALDGQEAPMRSLYFRCDTARWRFTDQRQEKSA